MWSKEVRVGVFVMIGSLVVGGLIFIIGDSRRLFERHAEFNIVFKQVQGLGRGSPVRMGGLDVGTVANVRYGDDTKDDHIYVTVSIAKVEAVRIRDDSVASIASKGLLGDKMVVITTGAAEAAPLPVGSTIRSKEADDLENMIGQLTAIAGKAEQVVTNLAKTTGTIADDGFREDMRAGMSSLRKLLDSVANGKGYANKLLTDPAEAQRVSNTIANLEKATASLDQFIIGLTVAVDRVNKGPGLVHEVIYGEQGAKTIASVGVAADEAAALIKTIRGEGGGEQIGAILEDLSAASRDLKGVAADLRAGKGTLGALLMDPSVYEDVKVMLGNVQRNEALRALVRYSIQSDEKATPAPVVGPSGGEASLSRPAPVRASGSAAPADSQKTHE